jgi:hypothetical protein
VVEWLLVTHAAAFGIAGFQDVGFFGLVGAEGVAAEFGVGPAGADEPSGVGPIFGKAVEEAAYRASVVITI